LLGGASAGTSWDFAVARFTPNGLLDSTFGNAGVARLDLAGRTDQVYDLAVQPDGGIIAVGTSTAPGGNPEMAVARFTSAGTIDASFNGGQGWLVRGFGGNAFANSVSIQPVTPANPGDAAFRIVVAGDVAVNQATVLGYTAAGSPDPAFAN